MANLMQTLKGLLFQKIYLYPYYGTTFAQNLRFGFQQGAFSTAWAPELAVSLVPVLFNIEIPSRAIGVLVVGIGITAVITNAVIICVVVVIKVLGKVLVFANSLVPVTCGILFPVVACFERVGMLGGRYSLTAAYESKAQYQNQSDDG